MSFLTIAEQSPEFNEYLGLPYIVGLAITATVVTITIAVRLYAQWLIKNIRAWDNILSILAFLCLIPLNFFTAWQFIKGAGYHVAHVLANDSNAPMDMRSIFIAWYWCSILSAQACLWIKLAMLMFINRVLPCDIPFFRIGWWIVAILTAMIGVGATIEFSVACLPVNYYWDRTIQYYGPLVGNPAAEDIETGWCMPLAIYLEVPLIASFVTDVFLFLLPLIPLWGMKLPLIKKFSVFLTLSLGLFAIGIDIVRIYEIVHFDVLGDVTWTNTPGVAWNAIEYNVALVSACIPAMAPLLRKELWKRGPGIRLHRRAFDQLDDDSILQGQNASTKNLLRATEYHLGDYRVWGDRSEQWRDAQRRESDAGSIWSGDTRSDSRALERERLRKESVAAEYGRRTSESTTIHEMVPISPVASSPRKGTNWV